MNGGGSWFLVLRFLCAVGEIGLSQAVGEGGGDTRSRVFLRAFGNGRWQMADGRWNALGIVDLRFRRMRVLPRCGRGRRISYGSSEKRLLAHRHWDCLTGLRAAESHPAELEVPFGKPRAFGFAPRRSGRQFFSALALRIVSQRSATASRCAALEHCSLVALLQLRITR